MAIAGLTPVAVLFCLVLARTAPKLVVSAASIALVCSALKHEDKSKLGGVELMPPVTPGTAETDVVTTVTRSKPIAAALVITPS